MLSTRLSLVLDHPISHTPPHNAKSGGRTTDVEVVAAPSLSKAVVRPTLFQRCRTQPEPGRKQPGANAYRRSAKRARPLSVNRQDLPPRVQADQFQRVAEGVCLAHTVLGVGQEAHVHARRVVPPAVLRHLVEVSPATGHHHSSRNSPLPSASLQPSRVSCEPCMGGGRGDGGRSRAPRKGK